MLKGSCLCGAVAFSAGPPEDAAIACHCTECRRQSGHHFASVPVATDSLRYASDEGLRWYAASDTARRGFCGRCGATLFWHKNGSARIYVLMGSLEAPTGLRLGSHVWVAEKGDYYDIADGLPQEDGD